MEYLDLYDKNGNTTGDVILRTHDKANVPEGKYIKLVLVFIKNSDNKFLIQLTSKEKGSVYATTGGHVKAGQSSIEAIHAEVSEELGLDISHEDIKLIGSMYKGFALIDVYYLEKDIDLDSITLQVEEVDSVNWYSIDEIRHFIEEGTFRKGNIDGLEMVLDHLNCK